MSIIIEAIHSTKGRILFKYKYIQFLLFTTTFKMLYSYHRGQYLQRGRGLGGIFSTLMRWLKPIIPKILSFGKKSIQDPVVKNAVHKIKNEAINAGSRAINKKLKSIAPTPPIPTKKIKKATKNITVKTQNCGMKK